MTSNEANIRQIHLWKSDSWKSVEYYNNWFLSFAPKAFREARKGVLSNINSALKDTQDFTTLSIEVILKSPALIGILRMITAPPLAQDRLAGLSYTNKSILKSLEQGKLPRDIDGTISAIDRMLQTIKQMIDRELFPWFLGKSITSQQRARSAAIIADRMTGALSDPIIRNAQEKRQLNTISRYLDAKGYTYIKTVDNIADMHPKTYSFHVNAPVTIAQNKNVNMPIDVAIKSSNAQKYPLLVECKSAGDFTNTNKRRKEEATKISQLRSTYGEHIQLCLYLCGYFDTSYLGYEAAEGIDWVWEHRTQDFENLGI